MRTLYIRELSLYTPQSLAQTLQLSEAEAIDYIRLLCAHGVLKLKTNEDKKDYDVTHGGRVRGSYQFVYVGLVLVGDLCVIVYPKYMPMVDPHQPTELVLRTMTQVFRVLRKHGGSYSEIAAMTEEGMRANDRLALMLMLLEMYEEYGVYSNFVRVLADNGPGGISWERTIAGGMPYMSNGVPIYLDYKTVESDRDSSDYVMRLHCSVLTACSQFLQMSGIASLLSLDEVWLTDTPVKELGDAEFVKYRLERERASQYVTWKQEVIDLLERYVAGDESTVRQDVPLCLGTSSFFHVWEDACKVAFDDSLGKRLLDLGVHLEEPFDAMGEDRLIDIIPKPLWTKPVDDDEEQCGEVRTLIPDTILLHHDRAGNSTFAILDAKYYTPELGSSVSGVPGVESVTKQFLYQAAYRRFVLAHGYRRVVNAFLAPSAGDSITHAGRVRFPGVISDELPPFSSVVDLYSLPAQLVFDAYLANEPLDNSELLAVLA